MDSIYVDSGEFSIRPANVGTGAVTSQDRKAMQGFKPLISLRRK